MLILSNFKNETDSDSEYVEFKAIGDTDLGHYALLDNTFSNGKLSNIFRHFYKLPNKTLKAGEYVKVFTGNKAKAGKTYNRNGDVNVKVHYVSMGSDACIWNNSQKDKLELIKYQTITARQV